MRQRVCQLDCKFAATACGNEGPCAVGTTDWQQGLGCPSSDGSVLGRAKTCNASCQYTISTACTPQPADFNSVVITNNTVGATFTKEFTFVSGKTAPRITTSSFSQQACPTTVGTSTTLYQYVTIKNGTAAAVKLSIYQSAGVTVPIADADTVMAIYAGSVPPSTPAQRNACIGFTNDACDSTLGASLSPVGCEDNAAGLLKGELVGSTPYAGTTLAAGASLQVYVSEYSSTSLPGHFKISARIEN